MTRYREVMIDVKNSRGYIHVSQIGKSPPRADLTFFDGYKTPEQLEGLREAVDKAFEKMKEWSK